ncbi:hypothetical protein WOLCODRAFT_28725 [Wolfiporia cocos MD-104 SS10]|uniref:PB1 domain-containing protein n=1 Tax=Wolfiporia cocos (strain MD-104) TaxID=742152 RepID=A0A2H3JAA2_WOLCO|nr:hypothetical protein WOLCODRAFT_28725 [Wolfiporia cocos MD-104 SS10]
MSLKAELETWAAALKAYDEEDFEKSLELFSQIADSSKILTNMGLIYATLGEHDAAVEQFQAATQLDTYLSVAYFQCGVSNFLLGRYESALRDFDDAALYMRGNADINYEQLGLKFRLYSAEVLFNKGLSRIYMGQTDEGLRELGDARREKVTEEHNVIDDAIQDRGEGYTVFSIPVGVLYRPAEKKIKNSKTKDYMGKAKLVAAEDATEAYTEFTGVARMRQATGDGAALSRSATVANATPSRFQDDDRAAPLQRSKTTINVSTAPSAFPRSQSNPTSPSDSPARTSPANGTAVGASLARSATSAGRVQPTRGLSIRKPAGGQNANGGGQQSQRTTEFLDNYIDSYADTPLPPLPERERTGGNMPRGRSTANGASAGHARTRSQPATQSVMRRKPTRRGTGRPGPRAVSQYEEWDEEEEEWDEPPVDDLVKIRVKLHYQDDVRGMALTPDMPWEDFLARVTGKFGRALDGLGMKFKDEDGGQVSLRDEMDYELAIETARETAKGKPEGRLEIWCTDE